KADANRPHIQPDISHRARARLPPRPADPHHQNHLWTNKEDVEAHPLPNTPLGHPLQRLLPALLRLDHRRAQFRLLFGCQPRHLFLADYCCHAVTIFILSEAPAAPANPQSDRSNGPSANPDAASQTHARPSRKDAVPPIYAPPSSPGKSARSPAPTLAGHPTPRR